MSQKEKEYFKEYAQRWRELAARVHPLLVDRELTDIFMSTLKGQYYRKLISSVTSSFSDLVIVGERVEEGLKSGKIPEGSETQTGAKNPFNSGYKKKEGETNDVSSRAGKGNTQQVGPPPMPYFQYPYVAAVQYPTAQYPHMVPTQIPVQAPQNRQGQNPAVQNQNQQRGQQQRPNQPPRQPYRRYTDAEIEPIPMTYTQLLPYLIQNGTVTPRELPPMPKPHRPWYDENSRCAYHANSEGHSIENYKAFKAKVQSLIDQKMLSFADVPNVSNNPLPGHGGPSVQAIEHKDGSLVRDVTEVKTSMVVVRNKLIEAGLIGKVHNECRLCLSTPNHCMEFKTSLQQLMD